MNTTNKSNYYQNILRKKIDDLDRLIFLLMLHSPNDEEWREIPKTEGKNFVSSQGRVISLRNNRAIFLKPFVCGDGYYYVSLRFEGQAKFTDVRVHRLVAQAFLENPENKPVVHHKDLNKKNNCVDNLTFMSYQEHAETHKKLNKEAPADEALLSTL